LYIKNPRNKNLIIEESINHRKGGNKNILCLIFPFRYWRIFLVVYLQKLNGLDKIVLPTNMGREESGLMKISFYLNLFLTFLP